VLDQASDIINARHWAYRCLLRASKFLSQALAGASSREDSEVGDFFQMQ
jgi:hypothetical protein